MEEPHKQQPVEATGSSVRVTPRRMVLQPATLDAKVELAGVAVRLLGLGAPHSLGLAGCRCGEASWPVPRGLMHAVAKHSHVMQPATLAYLEMIYIKYHSELVEACCQAAKLAGHAVRRQGLRV